MHQHSDQYINLSIACDQNYRYLVSGTVKISSRQPIILKYYAPNSADFRQSDTGSALPFPTKRVAYDPSNNVGECQPDHFGRFVFELNQPNSYYVENEEPLNTKSYQQYYDNTGLYLITPYVRLELYDGVMLVKAYRFKLNDGYPNRSLVGLPGRHSRAEP